MMAVACCNYWKQDLKHPDQDDIINMEVRTSKLHVEIFFGPWGHEV
jgi:hypothetical protein